MKRIVTVFSESTCVRFFIKTFFTGIFLTGILISAAAQKQHLKQQDAKKVIFVCKPFQRNQKDVAKDPEAFKNPLLSSSATYTDGDIPTDRNFTSVSGSSSCPGTLTVTIPEDAAITGVDVSYTMTARYWGWMSEQRSQLRCVSPGGLAEPSLAQGVGNSSGTYNYSRTGLDIANGVSGGGDINFELHAGRTWGGSGCNTFYNKVDNNSWTVTVHYTSGTIPDFTANPASAAPGQTITFTDNSVGTITSWEWDFGEGAIPATANTQGPHEVIYSSLGHKSVSLTVNGYLTETKTNYILIAEPDNWLHWDDGINFTSVGTNSLSTYQTAARFEPADISLYSNYQITMVKVYVRDLPDAITLKIWQGPDSQNLTEYVSQNFDAVADSWNIIELDNPYNINTSQELWFGAEWNDPGTNFFPVGIDQATDHDGKGNMLRLNTGDPNAWQPLTNYDIDGDWNIQAYLAPDLISWTGAVSSGWNNSSNWSGFTVPQADSDVEIPETPNNPIIETDVTVNSIVIETGASLTIGSQASLTVSETISNNAGNPGLVILSDENGTGSFLCTAEGVQAGFQRYITGEPEAWHLLSSPVSNQEISGEFTPAGSYGDGTGYDFYSWYEPDTSWVYLLNTDYPPTWSQTQSGHNFVAAKGYLVSYQSTNPTKTFLGILSTGNVSIDITKTTGTGDQFGANLVGNPYPSSIDWKAATGWSRSALEPDGGGYNIWIWNDTAYNYGVYNSASANDEGTLGVSRYIPPTQGFFVQAAQSGTLEMNDEVRTHAGAGGWLKSTEKKNLLLLSLESEEGLGHDQVVIEFGHEKNTGGTPKKFSFISSAPGLYIPENGIDYSILMLENTSGNPVIPLSAKINTPGNYSITAHADSAVIDMLILIDQTTGYKHNLLQESVYHFSSVNNNITKQFTLQLEPGSFADPHQKLPVNVYAYNQVLYIDLRLVEETCTIDIIELTGQLVQSINMEGGEKYQLPLRNKNGLFIVSVMGNQAKTSYKVVF